MRLSMCLLVGALALGCGESTGTVGGGSGTGASPTAPAVPDMSGFWNGTATITGASGCGCVGSSYNDLRGTERDFTMQLQQDGPYFSGRTTDNESGISCDLDGTIISSSSWSMTASDCAVTGITDFECPNGRRRDLILVASEAEGTVSGSMMAGTQVETWNCYNSASGVSIGVLTIRSDLSAAK